MKTRPFKPCESVTISILKKGVTYLSSSPQLEGSKADMLASTKTTQVRPRISGTSKVAPMDTTSARPDTEAVVVHLTTDTSCTDTTLMARLAVFPTATRRVALTFPVPAPKTLLTKRRATSTGPAIPAASTAIVRE